MGVIHYVLHKTNTLSDWMHDTIIKIWYSVISSVILCPVLYLGQLADAYILKDKGFIVILFLLFIIDIAMGMVKHAKMRTFSSFNLVTKALIKLLVCSTTMVIFNAFSMIHGMEEFPDLQKYFLLLGKVMNASYISSSTWYNMYIVTNGKFPPIGWMKRLRKFNEDLNLNDLLGNENRNKTMEE